MRGERGARGNARTWVPCAQVTRGLQKSLLAQRALLVLVLLATCMLIGDGCLTPSISVVSSISGLQQISSINERKALTHSPCWLQYCCVHVLHSPSTPSCGATWCYTAAYLASLAKQCMAAL